MGKPTGESGCPGKVIKANDKYEQASCRRLSRLLQALSYPERNAVKYPTGATAALPRLVCGVLRRLYQKAITLWEEMFEHLRAWISGRRDKATFSEQKATVAQSLAQLLNCIERYNEASRTWSNRVNLMALAGYDR